LISRSGLVRIIGLCLIGIASSPGAGHAEEATAAGLTRALAAVEAKEGKASPYLLPVIEQLAQFRLREGELGESSALRRRALDIAIKSFGSGSASAAEAMTALAMVAIDRRRYLDAEPLLIVAGNWLAGRVAPDQPVMVTILAGRARIALARGETGFATLAAILRASSRVSRFAAVRRPGSLSKNTRRRAPGRCCP
jgi:hypothetical protein